MDALECIGGRRSIRAYRDGQLPYDTVMELITLGTKAATGSNHQPWGFVVIQDPAEIEALSGDIKEYLRNNLEQYPYLSQYESWLNNEKYSVFNHAPTLIVIYGDASSHWYVYDCSLAAGNIMLAAHSMGIGTCWIGFAEYWLNTPEFKRGHGVPESYGLAATLGCGYMKAPPVTPPKRNPPVVFSGPGK